MSNGSHILKVKSISSADKLSYYKLLADLIHRYLDENDNQRRRQVFNEIRQLSEISLLMTSKKRNNISSKQ